MDPSLAVPSAAVLTTNSGRRWLFGFLILAVAWLQSLEGLGFVDTLKADRNTQLAAIAQRAAPTSITGNRLIIKLPKARGFQTMADIPKESVVQPLEYKVKHQRKNFYAFSNAGYNVSEVFVRFEGLTPWKRIGEVSHKEGDFVEAIRCQYEFLIQRSYKLYRKFRFFYQKSTPVQFGYTDTEGEIVPVDEGPPELGLEPQELKAMIKRSGFLGAEKPKQRMNRNQIDLFSSKKDHHKKKPHLMRRSYNYRIEAHRWWNPRKYRGRYMEVQTRKRGIVAGTGPSR